MAKTLEERYEEIYAKGKTAADKQHAVRQATDEETKAKIGQSIDKALQTATGQYQQAIDQAPAESRVQYDQNAMADAVNRMRIKESLANMGMTDSGLSSSMQTALAVQKSRADAGVRSTEQKKIQEARNAIAQLTAEAEGQKAQNEMDIDRATSDWYTGVMAQLAADSQTAAADAYAADMDYDARVAEAKAKAEQEAANRAHEVLLKRLDNGEPYAQVYGETYGAEIDPTGYMTAHSKATAIGYTPEYADVYATAVANGEDPDEAVELEAASRGKQVVNGLKSDPNSKIDLAKGTGAGFVNALFKGGADDAKYIVEVVERQLAGVPNYVTLSETEKMYALAVASGESIYSRWADKYGKYTDGEKEKLVKGLSEKFSGFALESALAAAGLDTETE